MSCKGKLGLKIAIKIPLMFPVAGIAYEAIKLSGRFAQKNLFVRMLTAPGLLLQNLTTREPTDNFEPDTYWGTDLNFDESETNVSTATYTHRFSSDTAWRTQLRKGDYERSYWARTPNANQAPNAEDDSVNTAFNTAATITYGGNDTDPEDGTPTLDSVDAEALFEDAAG